jgi:hypothetical protein
MLKTVIGEEMQIQLGNQTCFKANWAYNEFAYPLGAVGLVFANACGQFIGGCFEP